MQNLRSFILYKFLPFLMGVVVLVIIFVGIAYGEIQFITSVTKGAFVRWEQLPQFPTEPAEIIPSIYGVWVRDTNDTIYTIKVFTANKEERDRWYEETEPLPEDWLSPYPPCTREELPTSLYGSAPSRIVDCQYISYGPEAGSSYVVLDDKNQLWLFRNMNVGTGWLIVLPFLLVGALVVSLFLTRWDMQRITRFFAQSDKDESTQIT